MEGAAQRSVKVGIIHLYNVTGVFVQRLFQQISNKQPYGGALSGFSKGLRNCYCSKVFITLAKLKIEIVNFTILLFDSEFAFILTTEMN